jgi:uncharacterized protein UPF0047
MATAHKTLSRSAISKISVATITSARLEVQTSGRDFIDLTKTMLTATSLEVPVLDGELALGTWQAIYLVEHRSRPHRREIILQFIGDTR